MGGSGEIAEVREGRKGWGLELTRRRLGDGWDSPLSLTCKQQMLGFGSVQTFKKQLTPSQPLYLAHSEQTPQRSLPTVWVRIKLSGMPMPCCLMSPAQPLTKNQQAEDKSVARMFIAGFDPGLPPWVQTRCT